MPIKNPNYANLNPTEIAAAIGLKEKHIPMLIESFLEESAGILVKLQTAIDAKDYDSVKLYSHSIKGSAGNLRFTDVYDMAKEMELSAADSASGLDYQAYCDAIKNAISTIKI